MTSLLIFPPLYIELQIRKNICIILFFATSCYYYYCINKLKNSIKLKLGEVDYNKIKIEHNEFEYTTAQIEAPQFKPVTNIDTKEAKKTNLRKNC